MPGSHSGIARDWKSRPFGAPRFDSWSGRKKTKMKNFRNRLELPNYLLGSILLGLAVGTAITAIYNHSSEYTPHLACCAIAAGLLGLCTRIPEKRNPRKQFNQQSS